MENAFNFDSLPVCIEYVGDRSRDTEWPHDEWRIELSNTSGYWSTVYKTGLGHRKYPKGFIVEKKLNPRCLAFEQQERKKKPVKPSIADVMHSLLLDASAADENFHDWCGNYGYSDDSISALNTYKLCLETATALRKYIEQDVLAQVRKAVEEM